MSKETIDALARKIICNKDIRDILLGENLNHPYAAFVAYQRGLGIDFEEDGFQVGEHWSGDLENASILFLGPNPAITVNEVNPRYFPQNDKSKEDKSKDTFKMYKKENGNVDFAGIGVDGVINFSHDRFAETPMNRYGNFVVNILDENGNIVPDTYPVKYWLGVVSAAEMLMPDIEDRRVLMEKVVLAEMVPFRTMGQREVRAVVSKCWDDFTKEIIECSTAPVFVILGAIARDGFLKKTLARTAERRYVKENFFDANKIYEFCIGGAMRKIVHITHPSDFGAGNDFANRFGGNSEVLGELREVIESHRKAQIAKIKK